MPDRAWFKSQTGVTLGKVSALPDPVSLPRDSRGLTSQGRGEGEMREKMPDTQYARIAGDSVIIPKCPSQQASCPMDSAQGQGYSAEDAVATVLGKGLFSPGEEPAWLGRGRACSGPGLQPWGSSGPARRGW